MATRALNRAFASPLIPLSTTTLPIRARPFSSAPSLQATKQSNKAKTAKDKAKKKRKRHPGYKQYDLKEIEQFTLCDAIRYIKSFEVGRNPDVPKYDLAIKLRTNRDGPVIRNQIRLPHAVKTDIKVAVICPPGSAAEKAAKAAGATLVGEEDVFERIKSGIIDFDRCIAHPLSLQKMNKEGIPRILGPRGLMPSAKMGTVVENVGPTVLNMLGGSVYRERQGVIRMAIGRMGFTPEQLRDNVKAFVGQIKVEATRLSEQTPKEVHEVVSRMDWRFGIEANERQVLSSTHSPGFSLNGEFKSEHSPPSKVLAAL